MNKEKKPYLTDYHLHCSFSADCDTTPEKMIESAMKRRLSSICFTDHNDLDFPDTPEHIKFDLDIDRYIETIKKLSEMYRSDIDIRCGIEQGVMPSTCEKLSGYSTEHPGLDFIICSSHVVDGQDPYYPETFINPDGSPRELISVYRAYFEDILYNVTHFSDYSVYGHLDYVMRYGPVHMTDELFADKYYPEFKDIITEILKNIISSGKGIEINTGSLLRDMSYMHPHSLILRLYKDLGGEILTFGSDAHKPEDLGYEIQAAHRLAKDIGFKAFCTFRDMKPEFHDLI